MDQDAYQINIEDNVATALVEIKTGAVVRLLGDSKEKTVDATTDIPVGHKIALADIKNGEPIVKYNVTIGRATKDIKKGSWVHLHNIESIYDTRSSHLDSVTGAPKDTVYE